MSSCRCCPAETTTFSSSGQCGLPATLRSVACQCVRSEVLNPVFIHLLALNEGWGAGVVNCLERGADLHVAQLMPLPLTVNCFSKVLTGFTFLVPVTWVVPDKGPLNWCVCILALNEKYLLTGVTACVCCLFRRLLKLLCKWETWQLCLT